MFLYLRSLQSLITVRFSLQPSAWLNRFTGYELWYHMEIAIHFMQPIFQRLQNALAFHFTYMWYVGQWTVMVLLKPILLLFFHELEISWETAHIFENFSYQYIRLSLENLNSYFLPTFLIFKRKTYRWTAPNLAYHIIYVPIYTERK